MTVKVSEQVMDVLRGSGVSIPFSDVEGEQGLFGVGLGLL